MEDEEPIVVPDLSGALQDLSGASQNHLYKAMLPYRSSILFKKSLQEEYARVSRTVVLRDTGEGPGQKVVHLDGRGNVSSFYYVMRPELRPLFASTSLIQSISCMSYEFKLNYSTLKGK